MKKGDKYFALGEYYDAANQYKKAYSQTKAKDKPLRGQRALKMADCYRRINYTQKAIAAYNTAVRDQQADTLALAAGDVELQLRIKNDVGADTFRPLCGRVGRALKEGTIG